jgi:hypothetical protein
MDVFGREWCVCGMEGEKSLAKLNEISTVSSDFLLKI